LCQGLFLINNGTFIAINGLVGLSLAPAGWMATLPVGGNVLGAALSATPVSRLQAGLGRKHSFQIGLVVAALSSALCAYVVSIGSFRPLVCTTLIAGFYSANAALQSFAGPELVAPEYNERAISLVLAGGVAGAFIGPNPANVTRGMLAVPFAGAYLALVGVALLGLLALSFIRFPTHVPRLPGAGGRSRPLAGRDGARAGVCRRHPGLLAGLWRHEPVDGSHTDTDADLQAPLRPHRVGARVACAGHVRAQLLHRPSDPAFRFGALPVMGVGWNLLFVGGTALVTNAYRPEEKNRAQGTMDMFVF